MRNPSELVLKAFLAQHPPEKRRALERFLPEKKRSELEKLPVPSGEISLDAFSHRTLLNEVHWSWLLPTLKTYPKLEQELFLSALESSQESLAEALGIAADGSSALNVAARGFLRQTLLASLVGPEDRLLPAANLPSSPLAPLLKLSKKELMRLIDLLSLHDLAAELRQIVETKMLKKIYSLLTEEEKKRLMTLMAHPETAPFPRIGLDRSSRWDGTAESLRSLLHRFGLARFGTALSAQDPDFIWYICHKLDIGRGTALYKLCSQETAQGRADGRAEAVVRQIEEWLPLFTT